MHIPPGWLLSEKGDLIHREFKFKDFAQAIAFVNQVAELAEKINHHPDMRISYAKVSLSLSTHDMRGVTDKDIHLALKINELPL